MKNRRKVISLITILLVCALFSACATKTNSKDQSTASSESTSQSTTKKIVDMDGNTIEVPKNVSKVGCTIGAINQMVLMLGSADKITATVPIVKTNDWFVKMFPKIKDVPAPFDTTVNTEQLLASKPDVIFAQTGSVQALNSVKETGIPIITVNISSPENLKKAITIIGQTLGSEEEAKAAEFCAYYDANVKRLSDKIASIPSDQKVKVFVAGADNSGTMPLSTEGKGSIVTSWIEQAGGINVAAEAGVEGLSQKVSIEDVIKWNPDVIITTAIDGKNAILKSDQWKDINAVKNNKIFVNPKGVYLWSVRSAEAALQPLWAAKILHPDLFSDIDINKEMKNFYSTYYNYSLTDDDVNDILNPTK